MRVIHAITYDKSCLSLYNSTFCTDLDNKTFAKVHKSQQDDVQATSSGWMMRSNIAMGVPSTLSLLLWMGSWGDRVGRRLPLVVPCVGDILYSACNLINAIYMDASPAFLMIGPVFSGLSGGYLAVLMASYTYLTHLASPDRRMMRVGVAEAAVFLAGTISVFLSGKLVDTLGFVPVFGISLGCQWLVWRPYKVSPLLVFEHPWRDL
nr:hypothetical protein BaRGS_030147 [Batillaria attramentaria]